MKTENKIALGVFAGIMALVYLHKQSGTSGIGAARKRRIYKELSLAQQAGVDFTKPYDELDPEEIEALQRVSAETGYTETYYKSLQKAYNAVSGIGEAYDVVNADGETVLTWIDDPEHTQPHNNTCSTYDDPERERALIEARDIEADREWAQANKANEFEAREKRLAQQRKRLAKAGRTSQMALFGCGALSARDALEPELFIYLNRHLDQSEIRDTMDEMADSREPLDRVNSDLEEQIMDLVNQWCDNTAIDPDSVWSLFDPEDIFWEL